MIKIITKSILVLLAIQLLWFGFVKINETEIVELSERACYLNTNKQLEKEAANNLEELIRDAEDDGMCLVVTSGHRTYEEQKELYEEYGPKKAEKPGDSEHESGLAVDFGGCPMTEGERDDQAQRLELKKDFKELPEYKWLKNNAHKYGFSQTYQGDDRMIEEPWHWKYNK